MCLGVKEGTLVPSAETMALVADARAIFEYYLASTAGPGFTRTRPQGATGVYLYPEALLQVDTGAFAGVFTCLWRALEVQAAFDYFYSASPIAFQELTRIVTPNAGPDGLTECARFWVHDQIQQVTTADDSRKLCRTLRNGFAHFNFRYIHVAPTEYFARLNLVQPSHIPDPLLPMNYRLFICDWRNQRGRFMDQGSDTRIIETHFAHLRYHLFRFLACFFLGQGATQYSDILTGDPITLPPQ
jgi:hypothetical protein